MLAATAGCQPRHIPSLLETPEAVPGADRSLADKSRRIPDKKRVLGYPINLIAPPEGFFSWREQLRHVGIGQFAYNNVGDPFRESCLPYNTHDFERELIRRFGALFGFSQEDLWGFLSHSGTDSNMHGMYMGRTLLKSRAGRLPKAYFTREAHYSIQILQDLLGLEWVEVETKPDGSMDPDDLRAKLAEHADHPALVVATVGTTFKGAIDPVDGIRRVLQGHPSYLHVDAALFGGYLPYTAYAEELLQRPNAGLGAPRYDSLAVSCHKFFGFPAPAGLFITTRTDFDEFHRLFGKVHNPDYIHHVPGTITCSRDAVKPAEFFFFSTPSARTGMTEAAAAMLRNAAYLHQQLRTQFPHLEPTRASDRSNTVYFRKPSHRVVRKYTLATVRATQQGKIDAYAHVVVMPHATQEVLDEFLSDLAADSPASARHG